MLVPSNLTLLTAMKSLTFLVQEAGTGKLYDLIDSWSAVTFEG